MKEFIIKFFTIENMYSSLINIIFVERIRIQSETLSTKKINTV